MDVCQEVRAPRKRPSSSCKGHLGLLGPSPAPQVLLSGVIPRSPASLRLGLSTLSKGNCLYHPGWGLTRFCWTDKREHCIMGQGCLWGWVNSSSRHWRGFKSSWLQNLLVKWPFLDLHFLTSKMGVIWHWCYKVVVSNRRNILKY